MVVAFGRHYCCRMASVPVRAPSTIADWMSHPANEGLELIRGTLVEKAAPSSGHADAESAVGATLVGPFQRGRGGPGGWRFFTELHIRLAAEIFCPDVCAYRRERMPQRVDAAVIDLPPDWICEIVSPSNESHDRVEKRDSYFRALVPHYWLLNPVVGTLEVFRRTDLGYTLVLAAHRGQRVRPEPFDALELAVDELLSADPA